MSFLKKMIIAMVSMAAVSLTVAAKAGGVGDNTSKNPYAGIYVEGDVAYIYTNWIKNGPPWTMFHFLRKQRYGFNIGADAGYRFNKYLALEWGVYKLVTSKAQRVDPSILTSFRSWIGYAAGKVIVPVCPSFSFFAKAGVVRREITVTSAIVPGGDTNYWTVIFGAGFEYNVSSAVTLGIQYLRVPGYANTVTPGTNRFSTPAANLAVLLFGYRF